MVASVYDRDKGGKGKACAYFHDTKKFHSNPLNNDLSLKEKSMKLQGEGGCEGEFMKYMSYVIFIQADGGFYHNNWFLKIRRYLLHFYYLHICTT